MLFLRMSYNRTPYAMLSYLPALLVFALVESRLKKWDLVFCNYFLSFRTLYSLSLDRLNIDLVLKKLCLFSNAFKQLLYYDHETIYKPVLVWCSLSLDC